MPTQQSRPDPIPNPLAEMELTDDQVRRIAALLKIGFPGHEGRLNEDTK